MLKVLARLAALVTVLVAFAACNPIDPTQNGGATAKACNTDTVAPVYSDVPGTPSIMAKTVSFCDITPLSHRVTLWLERKTPTGWVPYVAKNGDETFSTCYDLPTPDHVVNCHRYVYRCDSGTYRTRALVSYVNPPTNEAKTWTVPEMPESVIAC
jgi:hypothetical protein